MSNDIEVVAVCPLIGKECIKDCWRWDRKTVTTCIFWDENTYDGVVLEEPCRIKRAVNKILADEVPDQPSDKPVEVPWDTEEKE